MEIEKLKARAYDLIVAQEQIQRELIQINKRIVEIQNKPKEETKKEDVTKSA
jgi:replicative DNA helicase